MPKSPEQVEVNAARYERYEYYMKKAEQAEAQLEEHSEELRFLESLTAPSVQPSGALIVQPF